jgi:hypothetical protein
MAQGLGVANWHAGICIWTSPLLALAAPLLLLSVIFIAEEPVTFSWERLKSEEEEGVTTESVHQAQWSRDYHGGENEVAYARIGEWLCSASGCTWQ